MILLGIIDDFIATRPIRHDSWRVLWMLLLPSPRFDCSHNFSRCTAIHSSKVLDSYHYHVCSKLYTHKPLPSKPDTCGVFLELAGALVHGSWKLNDGRPTGPIEVLTYQLWLRATITMNAEPTSWYTSSTSLSAIDWDPQLWWEHTGIRVWVSFCSAPYWTVPSWGFPGTECTTAEKKCFIRARTGHGTFLYWRVFSRSHADPLPFTSVAQ